VPPQNPPKPLENGVGFEKLDNSLELNPAAMQQALHKKTPGVGATRSAPQSSAPGNSKQSQSSLFDDGREVVVSIKGIRDLPPNSAGATHGLTVLRNPFVLVCLRAGRFRSRVVELSLNPVFNQYTIVRLSEDPIVLVEVLDEERAADSIYDDNDTVLLGSVMLSGDVLGPPPTGKEKKLWLPLSCPTSPVAAPGSGLLPHILVSIMAYKGDAGEPLEGQPLEQIAEVPGSVPSSARAMQPPSTPRSAPLSEWWGSSGTVSDGAGGSDVGLDDWEQKSAAVKAQLKEAAEWFKDEDVLKLMEGARNSRDLEGDRGAGGDRADDREWRRRAAQDDLPDASMPVVFM